MRAALLRRRLLPLAWPLLLATLAEGGGGSKWYKYEHEYNYCEAVLLIVFVFVALAFELVWHLLQHSAFHSYHYGRLHDQVRRELDADAEDSHGNHGYVQHLKLYNQLVSRMGGEFMTLGVLAFVIFTFNQAGVFEAVVARFHTCGDGDCFHLPETGSDLLHLAELTHVKLFLGMILYFVLMLFLVKGSVQQIEDWEKLHLRLVSQRTREMLAMEETGETAMDRDLRRHMHWCDYFIEQVLRWRTRRPELFWKVLGSLGIDQRDRRMEVVRKRIRERFSLSAYLALNVESGVVDSIQVHLQTWSVVIILFGFFALLHRYAEVALTRLTPFFIAFAFALLLVMWLLKRSQEQKMLRFVQEYETHGPEVLIAEAGPDISAGMSQVRPDRVPTLSIHQRHATETIILRVMQVFMFLNCYMFGQVLAEVQSFVSDFYTTLTTALLFFVLFTVLAKFLPRMVPAFLGLMSLPPFVDKDNQVAFFKVLNDHSGDLQSNDLTRRSRSDASLQGLAAAAAGGSDQAAVWELADILGVSGELEQRLRARRAGGSSEPLAKQEAMTEENGVEHI